MLRVEVGLSGMSGSVVVDETADECVALALEIAVVCKVLEAAVVVATSTEDDEESAVDVGMIKPPPAEAASSGFACHSMMQDSDCPLPPFGTPQQLSRVWVWVLNRVKLWDCSPPTVIISFKSSAAPELTA